MSDQKQEESKRGPGQPPKYETPEGLAKAIDEYFEDCKILEEHNFIDRGHNLVKAMLPKIPTITGLALFLGYASTQSLFDNADRSDSFSAIITRAKVKCGEMLNQKALNREVDPRIARLNLSANHGMSEKHSMEHSGKDGGPIKVTLVTFCPCEDKCEDKDEFQEEPDKSQDKPEVDTNVDTGTISD